MSRPHADRRAHTDIVSDRMMLLHAPSPFPDLIRYILYHKSDLKKTDNFDFL